MAESTNLIPFPQPDIVPWIEQYQQTRLTDLPLGTQQVYRSILHHFFRWLASGKRKHEAFDIHALTPDIMERYFAHLGKKNYSFSHCKRTKSVLMHFCQWLVDDQALLVSNPLRSLILSPSGNAPASHDLPRGLSPTQRVIFFRLIEQDDLRGKALFALGYWSGCRVSEITHLLFAHTHVGPRGGWLHLEKVDGPARDIDLPNEARRALFDYLRERGRDEASVYVFLSQRSSRLSEAGLHHWFRTLKNQATPAEWEQIRAVRFQDLRDDFAYRAREAGWTEEEVAYYLGYFTTEGTISLRTTARLTQMTRAQVKEKLKLLKS